MCHEINVKDIQSKVFERLGRDEAGDSQSQSLSRGRVSRRMRVSGLLPANCQRDTLANGLAEVEGRKELTQISFDSVDHHVKLLDCNG